MTRVVHVPYVVEQDEDGDWCASAQLRPGVAVAAQVVDRATVALGEMFGCAPSPWRGPSVPRQEFGHVTGRRPRGPYCTGAFTPSGACALFRAPQPGHSRSITCRRSIPVTRAPPRPAPHLPQQPGSCRIT